MEILRDNSSGAPEQHGVAALHGNVDSAAELRFHLLVVIEYQAGMDALLDLIQELRGGGLEGTL